MYLRSKRIKKFSRGRKPYSLHIKSFVLNFGDSKGIVGLSSSNFAVRDLVKEENLIIIKDEPDYFKPTLKFCRDLTSLSIPIDQFDFSQNYSKFSMPMLNNPSSKYSGFMAPFYKNSAFAVEDLIKEKFNNAQDRIHIIGQHICPVNYNFPGRYHSEFENTNIFRKGLVDIIVDRAKIGVDVKILSQTFSSGDYSFDIKFRNPINKKSFVDFFNSIRKINNISYYVNENIHSKYIIIDEMLFITSFNYTPTQFIFLDEVNIPNFDFIPNEKYQGVYCEVGHFYLIKDKKILNSYINNFNMLLNKVDTKSIFKN